MPLDFKEIFQTYADSRKKTWAHDRSLTVGASEIFGCLRKGWFEKNKNNKYDKDDDDSSWGATMRGDIIEEHYVVPALEVGLPKEYKLLLGGDDQQTFIDGLNSATPDGLIVGLPRDALANYGIPDIKSNCVGLEIKSIDPRMNLVEEKTIHHGQCIQQMGLVRTKTKWRPYYTVILYVDASFLDQIKVFVVEWSPQKWKAAQKRADMIFNTDDPKDIRPEGKLNDGCKFCKWQTACSIVTIGSIPPDVKTELDDEDRDTLLELIQKERENDKLMKELKEESAEIKQEIKDEFSRLGRRWCSIKYDGYEFSARWSSQKGRQSFDKKAAEDAGIDLEPFMKTGDPIETFSCKLVEIK